MVGLVAIGMALTPPPPPGKDPHPHWIFGIGACWLLIYLPSFLIVHLTAMRPTGSNRKSIVLSGASRDFEDALLDEDELDDEEIE
jgi:hypothetical protein